MSRLGKKSGIPDRWLDYSAVGSRLDGTRFVAFKVPLKQALNHQLPPSEVFGPWELLDALRQRNQELGLIIDLTNTARYYSRQDIPESLLVVKILTAGHEVPSDSTILSFKRAVRTFLRDNRDNDKLIGVHCTHGVNRTGYLICRYLIDVDGMEPEGALQLFSSSRGHTVERHNYLQDLQLGPKRSNEGMEQSEERPQRGEARHPPRNSSVGSQQRPDHNRNPDRNHSWYPERNPSWNPDRNHSWYPEGNPSWNPVRNHSWYPEGNPSWNPVRNHSWYPERNHRRNLDGKRSWYPDRNHSRNPDRTFPPHHHGNPPLPFGPPAPLCWTRPDADWRRSRSPLRNQGRSRYSPPEHNRGAACHLQEDRARLLSLLPHSVTSSSDWPEDNWSNCRNLRPPERRRVNGYHRESLHTPEPGP